MGNSQSNTVIVTNEARIIAKARKGLGMVAEGETKTMEGWLVYGEALNEGREMFPSDERFGQWVCDNLLHTEHRPDRAAAMWAAANPEDYKATRKANPQVRTVRGLHAKWKNPVGENNRQDPPLPPEMSMLRKLKATVEHPTTDPNVRENAQRKLDRYCRDFGIDVGELEEPEMAVGMTRREIELAIAEAILRNHTKKRARAFITAALDAAYTDDELLDTLNQVKEYL